MTDGFIAHQIAPGLHRVTDYRSARQALADPRLIHWMARDGAPNAVAQGIARWLDAMDPAARHPLRKTVAAALMPAAMQRLAPDLMRAARQLTASLGAVRDFDVDHGYARPLTHHMVCLILGIDDAARPALGTLLDRLEPNIIQALFPTGNQTADTGFFERWHDLVASAMRPGGLAAGIAADLDRTDSTRDLGAFTAMFAFAAGSNISRLIAGAAHGFAALPDVYARLQCDPALIPAAVEEWLRYRPPLAAVHLVAATTIHEGRIRAGDSVLVALDEANRDAAMFRDGDTFRLGEQRPAHLSFGSGPLTCIGSVMARSLAALALGHLVEIATPVPGADRPYPIVAFAPRTQEAVRRADAIT